MQQAAIVVIANKAPVEGALLRVVLDTNVVMALWHFGDPGLAQLRACIAQGEVLPITRADCLDELQRVLAYSQFGLSPAQQAAVLAQYSAVAECVETAPDVPDLPQCRDRDDQKFLQLAWQGQAAALLTRDKLLLGLAKRPLFRARFAILTPERWQTAQCATHAGANKPESPSSLSERPT